MIQNERDTKIVLDNETNIADSTSEFAVRKENEETDDKNYICDKLTVSDISFDVQDSNSSKENIHTEIVLDDETNVANSTCEAAVQKKNEEGDNQNYKCDKSSVS